MAGLEKARKAGRVGGRRAVGSPVTVPACGFTLQVLRVHQIERFGPQVQPRELGRTVAIPQVGGLHHRYERRAALKTVKAVFVRAEDVRRYERLLALEVTIATDGRAVNPVSFAAGKPFVTCANARK